MPETQPFPPPPTIEPGEPVHHNWLPEQYKELVAAIRFLSILPVPGSTQLFRTDSKADARLFLGSAYFPLVGLLLAVLPALLVWIFGNLLSSLVLAALLVVLLIVLSGGLHLDGLMDTCDGLFGGRSREHKLEIMRDSRLGSFGILGGSSILLLKFALLASLDQQVLLWALLTIIPISRWTMVLAMYIFPPARATGLGAAFRQTVTRTRLISAAVLTLLIAGLAGYMVGLVLCLCATLLTWLVGKWITAQLGGLTGDSYGTLAELMEVVLLLLWTLLRFWL
ncbi:adenosylcobinamide-GDP ribazoletransferase [Dictyobacter formicarum]|uniref:Adenosylcobinamide-GDP ribazoletransferase n=1 Tax=Dictyobacter formicarum TaxID=2778368 RepID=A0ABQ3VF52_9CHLR|nr:adenosylcobinamide-GDP ribazoletransferase [Dictyobacter formicarum]GHO84018.1 adenosylcobinamide-GDP ribazoletransferase [Dictyobacter formicarum]